MLWISLAHSAVVKHFKYLYRFHFESVQGEQRRNGRAGSPGTTQKVDSEREWDPGRQFHPLPIDSGTVSPSGKCKYLGGNNQSGQPRGTSVWQKGRRHGGGSWKESRHQKQAAPLDPLLPPSIIVNSVNVYLVLFCQHRALTLDVSPRDEFHFALGVLADLKDVKEQSYFSIHILRETSSC